MLLKPYITDEYNKILLVGEAAGKEEEKLGLPFVGTSGNLLDKILVEAGLTRKQCAITNVFMSERPPSNFIYHFFVGITEAKQNNILICDKVSRFNGKFLRKEFQFELDRLGQELDKFNPSAIIALGATALWGLTGLNGITAYRGEILWSRRYQREILATFHPAAVLRDRANKKPLVVKDFQKAKTYFNVT